MTDYFLNSGGSNTSPYDTWAKGAATGDTLEAVPWTASDRIFASDTHAESTATAITWALPTSYGLQILSNDDAGGGSVIGPLTTTATVDVTGNSSINFSGHGYIYGFTFRTASGNNNGADISIPSGTTSTGLVFESCIFDQRSTNANVRINIGQGSSGSNDDCYVKLINCSVKFANSTQAIELRHGRIRIQGLTLLAGTVPTTLFKPDTAITFDTIVEASDLTGRSWTNLVDISSASSGNIIFRNCKMPSGWTATTGTNPGPGGINVIIDNCDDADTNYTFLWSMGNLGTIIEETTIVMSGGASDGTTPISWEMTSSANVSLTNPLVTPKPIVIWNETVGSSVTVTVEIVNDGTTLTNAEAWIEAQYLGTSGFPLGTVITDRVTDVLATAANQTTSSVSWTTTGLTTPVKQKLEVTFTPQEKGFILVYPCLARTSKTIFVNPQATLS